MGRFVGRIWQSDEIGTASRGGATTYCEMCQMRSCLADLMRTNAVVQLYPYGFMQTRKVSICFWKSRKCFVVLRSNTSRGRESGVVLRTDWQSSFSQMRRLQSRRIWPTGNLPRDVVFRCHSTVQLVPPEMILTLMMCMCAS